MSRTTARSKTSSILFRVLPANELEEEDAELRAQLREMRRVGLKEQWLIDDLDVHITEKLLGEGSYGFVIAGALNGTDVAFKVPKHRCRGSKALRYLAHELRILRHITHCNVVALYGAIIEVENPLIVLVEERIFGQTLQDALTTDTLPSSEDRHGILLGISRALRFLHNLTPVVVHGDLKPRNIMVEHITFRPKIVDFGLARLITRCGLERLGGTARYMAPELFLKDAPHPFSDADMFSFGRLVFFISECIQPLNWLNDSEVKELARLNLLPELRWSDNENEMRGCCRLLCDQCLQIDQRKRMTAEDAHIFVKRCWELAKCARTSSTSCFTRL